MKKESSCSQERNENKKKFIENESYKDNIIINENIFSYSHEGYKNKTIISFNDLDINFHSSSDEDISLFEKKVEAEKLIMRRETDESISIDKILSLDNTNKEAQKVYLKIAVNLLEKESDYIKKEILFEKIEKAGIILSETDYNNEVINLPKQYQEKLIYRNYKKILIN